MSDQNKGTSPQKGAILNNGEQEDAASSVNSLSELIDMVTGRDIQLDSPQEESGIAEILPLPFLAIIGQEEMKLALLLSLINPVIGGVLLIGPRGTGKTTSVRSLVNILPKVTRSNCFYGCMPEDIETGGLNAVCPDCAKKYGEGISLTKTDQIQIIELPLNVELEDVIGGIDDRAKLHNRLRLKRGLLSQADRNILYIDEVNLLSDDIVDAILDAAAQGAYTVRRGAISGTYSSRINLIGSMNPEEGFLRPQIMDRFGLRVIVKGLEDPEERLDAYNLVKAYQKNHRFVINQFAEQTQIAQEEIQSARARLNEVDIPKDIAEAGIELIRKRQIDSLRAEISMFEAARAHAAAATRTFVTLEDIVKVAPMALRMRRSDFMREFINTFASEEEELTTMLDEMKQNVKINPE